MLRENTKEIKIGNVVIGGTHPITIQSMTNTPTEDVDATVAQIVRLYAVPFRIKQLPKLSKRSKSRFIFLLLRIFILITEWQLLQLKTVLTRFESIPET